MSFEVELGGRIGAPFVRALTRSGARILMYHRFAGRPTPRRVDRVALADHLAYLVRHFNVCPLSTLAAAVRDGERLPPGSVAITIDDGYADFAQVAYRLLEDFEIPATVFVVTRFLDGDFWLWFDAVHYLLHAAPATRLEVTLSEGPLRLDTSSADARMASWSAVGDQLLRMDPTTRDEAIRELQDAFQLALPPVPTDDYRAMTWDEAAALDPQLVQIGSHTCTHPVLSQCSEAEIDREVADSRAAIIARLGRAPSAFCYPNGQRPDYDERCTAAVRRAGYSCATVAHGGPIGSHADPFTLERLSAPVEAGAFRRTIDGVAALADQWRAWRPITTF